MLARDNFTLLTDCLVTGLEFEGIRCAGVRHLSNLGATTTRATQEVILALGAINTPRLLMTSGIGNPAELKRLGVPVRAALPGVGQNLQDHPLVRAVNFRAKRALGPVRDNGGGSMLNWKTKPSLPQANAHAFPVQGPSATPDVAARYNLSGNVFAIGAGLMRSRSIGCLRLLGAEPNAPVEIQPNFLSEPEDLSDLVDAVQFVIELGRTKALEGWAGPILAPDAISRRDDVVHFIRIACSTFFHTCGTCKMGVDGMAVVDSRLVVRGVEGLRIADASVIPIIPSCNTHAPVTMIGERAADFALASQVTSLDALSQQEEQPA